MWRETRGRRTRDQGRPSLLTSLAGVGWGSGGQLHWNYIDIFSSDWDENLTPTDTWQRRGEAGCLGSWGCRRVRSRSGFRTREPSWRSLKEGGGSWPRCWRLRASTTTPPSPWTRRTTSSSSPPSCSSLVDCVQTGKITYDMSERIYSSLFVLRNTNAFRYK